MEKQRFYYFDFLRALAMLLGIPLHVAFAYTTLEYQWLIKDPQNSFLVDWGLYFLRTFRMPLFFIISGFFSHYMYQKKREIFVLERTKRLMIPLIVLFLVIVCPLRIIWLFGEVWSRPDAFSVSIFIPFLIENFLAPTTSRFNIPVSWGHLWFLLYLYCFSMASLLLAQLVEYFKIQFEIPLFILFILTYFSMTQMSSTWVDLPLGILPKPSLLVYYGLFYYFGWCSFSKSHFNLSATTSLALLVLGLTAGVLRAYLEVDLGMRLNHLNFSAAVHEILSSLAPWLISIGLIGSSKYLIRREYKMITFFVQASYSIYLIHLPIIVILQLIFFSIDLHWFLKLCIISLLTLIISALIYKYFVQSKLPERFLKGQYRLSWS